MLLVQEVETNIFCLQKIVKVDANNVNDEDIKSRKDDMSKHLQQLDNLPKRCRIYLNVLIQ